MPKFNTKEEYEKWKAQKLEDAKNRIDAASEQTKIIDQPLEVKFINASSRNAGMIITIIVLFVSLIIVLFYTLILKDQKSGNEFAQKTREKSDSSVNQSKGSADIAKAPDFAETLSSPAANSKSWPDIMQQAKRSVVVIKTSNSIGSGFVISPDGIIVTNSHVIRDFTEVEVIFNSNASKKASIIKRGTIPVDIAILKVAGDNFEYLTLADSNYCKEGEEVVAIGAPHSLSGTITKGIVSYCNRRLKDEFQDIVYIQTDTPISPGNSGGPLINKKGEVIGMLTWKIVRSGFEGLNFAITSNVINSFRDGRLDKIEESAKKVYEEKSKIISDYRDRLRLIWMNEYTSYYDKIAGMVAKGAISVEQGTQILYSAAAPPPGFSSIPDWLTHLAESVIKGEMTENQAYNLIKNSFTS